MTTFPSSILPTPALTDDVTLSAALECLKAHLPVTMQGECQPESLYEVSLWAASHHDSIEHAAQQLTGVPTGNDLRHHLNRFEDMVTVERKLNAALQSCLHRKTLCYSMSVDMLKHSVRLLLHYLKFGEVPIPRPLHT